MKKPRIWRAWGLAALCALGLLTRQAIGQQPANPPAPKPNEGQGERTGETIGRAVDRAVRDLGRGVEDVGQSLRQRFEAARSSVDRMGTEARIYGRLHWDKDLHSAPLELEVREGGAVVLRGAVADVGARAKAVMLTRETVGVTEVIDEITVRPRPATEDGPDRAVRKPDATPGTP